MRPLTLDEMVNGGVPDRADVPPPQDPANAQDVGGEG